MPSNPVTVISLADQLGVQKQWLFKIMKRLEIEPALEVATGARGQKVAHVTAQEADAIAAEVHAASADSGAQTSTEPGFFYLIQLEPEHDPGRFKFGFSAQPQARLVSHRTAAPLCRLIQQWPSRSTWERAAIDFATVGCEQLGVEVFRAESITEVHRRCEEFFGFMPDPGAIQCRKRMAAMARSAAGGAVKGVPKAQRAIASGP